MQNRIGLQLMKIIYQSLYLSVFLSLISLTSCRNPMPDPPVAGEFKYTASDSALTKYIRAENKYTDEFMSRISGLRQSLCEELRNRDGNSGINKEKIGDSIFCQSPDKKYDIFVKKGNTVFVHKTATNASEDRAIYSETRAGYTVSIGLSASKKFLFIRSFGDGMTETRFLPSDFTTFIPILIQPGATGNFYHVEHFDSDYFWIYTNFKAPNGKLVQAKIAHPESAFWIPIINYPDSTKLTGFALVNSKNLILFEQKLFRAGIRIVDLTAIQDPTKGNRIGFNEPEGKLVFSGFEAETGKILFQYSSAVTPETMYTYDLNEMRLGIRWQEKINGYNKNNYGSSIIWVTAKNGTKIPVTLVFHKDFEKRDGTNPIVLTNEKSSGPSGQSGFNSSWISLLDRGFYIAIVHGQDDKLPECASFLIAQKYTSKGLITGFGKCSGVEEIAAAASMQPDLFKAIILEGPAAGREINLKETKKPYPTMFLITDIPDNKGDNFWMEKMAVRIRKNKTNNNILLLKTGHSASDEGDTTCNDQVQSSVDWLAFILSCYGIEK
ncbi:MAG: hypothetical protein M0P47_10930 [Bacteroidales bacterium]|nr:hypothetical protein [Bacteroidales bacterium]